MFSEGECCLKGQISMGRPLIRWKCAGASAWSSNNRIPSQKSIYENIAFGARINGYNGNMDELVERSLRQAAVWDECKDKLNESGYSLSGGQQQRLCIARTIAIQPDVILMDEPCSALDPISTLKIEETMHELKKTYTIVIVTHNMQQAVRVSDMTAFYNAERSTTEAEKLATSLSSTRPKKSSMSLSNRPLRTTSPVGSADAATSDST